MMRTYIIEYAADIPSEKVLNKIKRAWVLYRGEIRNEKI